MHGAAISRLLFSLRRAAISLGPPLPMASSAQPADSNGADTRLSAYSSLLQAGFAVPPASLPERWALAPPFHPYLAASGVWRVPCDEYRDAAPGTRHPPPGGLFSVALSLGFWCCRPEARNAIPRWALPMALSCGGRTFLAGLLGTPVQAIGLASRQFRRGCRAPRANKSVPH